ncbi:MAG: hypothetical protein ACI8P7_000189 [Candidatus Azotimanducaceae bacterium]|jgi:hypothetical protein
MKLILLTVFTTALNLYCPGQPQDKLTAKNVISIEFGGYGGYGSLNYEYQFKSFNKFKFSTRAGIGTYHLKDFTNQFNPDIILPIGCQVYFGSKHHLELGLGQTFKSIVIANKVDYTPSRSIGLSTNLSIGYRYQKDKGGLVMKTAYSPILEGNKEYKNWFLLSVGYSY